MGPGTVEVVAEKPESPESQEEQEDVEQPRKAGARPSYFEMIADAIHTQKKKTGSSRAAISKHIKEKYANLPLNFDANLKKQLKHFLDEGMIRYDRVHKRSYKLCSKKADDFAGKAKRQKTH